MDTMIVRTPAPPTDGTDASPEGFVAHRSDRAQLTTRSNAVAENFFATLKKELVHRRSWPTHHELTGEVFEYIETVYSRPPRQSTLGMLSPADFENRTLSQPRCERCRFALAHSTQQDRQVGSRESSTVSGEARELQFVPVEHYHEWPAFGGPLVHMDPPRVR
jgi:Integrase core domain